MKKALIIFCSAILLSGCSIIQNILGGSGANLSEKFGKIWEQEIKNDEIRKEADIYNQIQLKNYPEATASDAEGYLDQIEQANEKADEYLEAVEKVSEKAETLADDVENLDKDLKEKAEEAFKTLMKTIEVETDLMDTVKKLHELNIKYYTSISNNEVPADDIEEYNGLADKRGQLLEELNGLINKFQDQWKDFHKEATGQELKLKQDNNDNDEE